MEGPLCSGNIALDVTKMKDGDCTGLAAFNGDSGVLTIKRQGKKYVLQMSEQKVKLTEREKAVTEVTEDAVETIELPSIGKKAPIVYLRIDGDFNVGCDIATFYYSIDGKQWTKIGSDYKMMFDYRRFFMGTKYAIFYYSTKKAGGNVDIDNFNYKKTENNND